VATPSPLKPRGAAAKSPARTTLFGRVLIALLVAGLVAIAAGAFVVWNFGEAPSAGPLRTAARTIQEQVEARAPEYRGMEAAVASAHRATGLDLQLVTDFSDLPRAARRATRQDVITHAGRGRAFIPISHQEHVIALVELRSAPPSPWQQLALPLVAAMLVLGIAAFAVARQLSRPIEGVAAAARMLGAGDLTARVAGRVGGGRELVALSTAFNEMAERVEYTVSDQRALLGAVSHELRSPLTRASVAIALARESGAGAAALDAAQDGVDAAERILSDLLMVTRTGLSDLRTGDIRVDELLAQVLRDAPALPEIDCEADPSLMLHCDAALVLRAIANLLQNARKYGHPEDAMLRLRIVQHNHEVRFVVRDLGPGIAAALLPTRLFEAFVRADGARTPDGSAGLGLALVKRIALAHGGSVGAHNAADEPDELAASAPRSDDLSPGLGSAQHRNAGATVWFSIREVAHSRRGVPQSNL
jgi:signal transduction histidine kinase